MKHPVIKLVGAIILLCALLIAYYQLVFSQINSRAMATLDRACESKVNALVKARESLESDQANRMGIVSERMRASAKLEAAMLRLSEAYRQAAGWEKAMIVRLSGGRVVYPAGSAVRLVDYEGLFGHDARVAVGTIANADSEENARAVISACPIDGDEYYVSWTDRSDDVRLFAEGDDVLQEMLSPLEAVYGGLWLDVVDLDGRLSFRNKPFFFSGIEKTSEEAGITREVLETRPDTLVIEGKAYQCTYKTIQEDRETGIFLTLLSGTTEQSRNQALIITVIAGILLVTVMAWHLATQRFVIDKILTKPMQRRYKPSKMRWMTLVAGCIGTIIVFMAGCVTHAIGDVSERSTESYIELTVLLQRLGLYNDIRESDARMSVDWYLDCGRRMGKAIEADPGLTNEKALAELCGEIGARYVMLFDEDGNEYACSTRYTGFSLGTQPEDTTTDFRRLLLGVPELAHDPAVDERTGVYTQMVGVGYRLPDERYGALILAFAPDQTDEAAKINEIIHSQTKPGWTTVVIDKESKIVRYSSDTDFIGLQAMDIGIPEDSVRERYMEDFWLGGKKYLRFFCRGSWTGILWHLQCKRFGPGHAGLCCLTGAGFTGIYLVKFLYLLFGYTNKQYESFR